MKNIKLTEDFFINCRDIINLSGNFDLFFSQRKLFQHIDKDYENYLKRLALLSDEGFDIGYFKPILIDAFSKGQIKSKIWLLENIVKYFDLNNKTIFLLGGWIGVLPAMLFWHTSVKNIRNIELDINCIRISNWLLKDKLIEELRYATIYNDMNNLDYYSNIWHYFNYENTAEIIKNEKIDLVINTSTEHLVNFNSWWDKIPKGMGFVLQSNNFADVKEHVNLYSSLTNFEKSLGKVSEIFFKGELDLTIYKRFMIIGKK